MFAHNKKSKQYVRQVGVWGDILAAAKYPIAAVLRIASRMRYAFAPTEEGLILFEAFSGRRADCNPLAIYNYLRIHYPGRFHYVWAVEDINKWVSLAANSDTDLVAYRSSLHRKYACTAGFLVVNNSRAGDLPYRKKQVQIQTWHGEGYKTVGAAAGNIGPLMRWVIAQKSKRFDYFISSNKYFTQELIRKQLLYAGEVLEVGTPRNDRLVLSNKTDRLDQRRRIGLSDDDFFVLYVPTWRDFGSEIESFDVEQVRNAFAVRFGSNVVMGQRGHYFSDFSNDMFDLDLGDYDDMQGLLLACDALISDYSSVIWDFSFTYRPCFLFAPDWERYERDRGFNEPISDWGFPLSTSNDELISDIVSFDEAEHRMRMEAHHARRGSFEVGRASEEIAHVILSRFQGC